MNKHSQKKKNKKSNRTTNTSLVKKLALTHDAMTVLDVAKLSFKKYGKGVFVYPGAGQPFAYVLDNSRYLNDVDRAMLDAYDPDTEVVLSTAMVEGDWYGPFMTSTFKATDRIANLGVLIPKSENFELHEKQLIG